MMSASASLAREFPDWRIDPMPGGLDCWSAYWPSEEDGRERRVIVERSAGELLARLRTVTQVTT